MSFLFSEAYCYDDMDTIPDLNVRRYDSSDPAVEISPDEPWASTGEFGPKFTIEFTEPTRINQLEFDTTSGNSVKVTIGVSFKLTPLPIDLLLFGGQPVEVNSRERLDIPPVPEIHVSNVFFIHLIFHFYDSQTIKVFGCVEKG